MATGSDPKRGVITSSNKVKTGSFVGQISQMTEFFLKENDLNAWIERFEFYVLLNEINKNKQKLMFLTLLGNDGYSLLRDFCTPFNQLTKIMMI